MKNFWDMLIAQTSPLTSTVVPTSPFTTTDTITNVTGWVPDVTTALMTIVMSAVIVPVAYFVGKQIRAALKEWSLYWIGGPLYYSGRLFKHSGAARFSLRHYCALQLKGNSEHLQVPSRKEISLNTDKTYVPLFMEQQGMRERSFTHEDLLTVGNRIIVAGDPGSGKSSLVKRLLRDTCHFALRNASASRLPVLIELRRVQIPASIEDKDLGDWFLAELRKKVAETHVFKIEEAFDDYSHSTGLLVLLDGLDEVSNQHFPRIWKSIEALSEKLNTSPENSLVLTMRTQFQQQIKGTYRDSFPAVMFLKPFSPTDIYEFLTRWPFHANAQRRIAAIFDSLSDRPSLREMCSNPLVLSMYVAEVEASGEEVAPDTRTGFYTKVTEELLILRRSKQIGPGVARDTLREQRERILGTLAYQHLLDVNQPANSLNWPTALEVMTTVTGCRPEKSEAAFRELATETGLVTEERPKETFRFIHLTFAEYLAAYEAVQGQVNGWDELISTHKKLLASPEKQLHSRLVEVIPFAIGLLPRKDRPEALKDVVALGDWRLTARAFLETKLYRDPEWATFAQETHDLLLSVPEAYWDTEWLRGLHLFNAVVADAEQSATHMAQVHPTVQLDGFYRKLVAVQQGSLLKLFSAYANQDAAAAFRLARLSGLDIVSTFPQLIISNLDQKPFLALALQQALDDKPRIGIWATLFTEAGLVSRAVATWLQDTPPNSDLSQYIRQNVSANKLWFKPGLFPQTLYTQLISIANSTDYRFGEALLLVDALRNTPPPSSFRATRKKGILVASLGWIAYFVILSFGIYGEPGSLQFLGDILDPSTIPPSVYTGFWIVLASAMLFSIGAVAFRAMAIARVFFVVLNLSDVASRSLFAVRREIIGESTSVGIMQILNTFPRSYLEMFLRFNIVGSLKKISKFYPMARGSETRLKLALKKEHLRDLVTRGNISVINEQGKAIMVSSQMLFSAEAEKLSTSYPADIKLIASSQATE